MEIWLVNTDKYCAKFLYLEPGFQCSLHRHLVKDETFVVMDGHCRLEVENRVHYLQRGDNHHIPPGTWHRFRNERYAPMCRILEVSTHHDDGDVERREPSKRIDG
jgi:quercetin dioxygenase-like cupin family protein